MNKIYGEAMKNKYLLNLIIIFSCIYLDAQGAGAGGAIGAPSSSAFSASPKSPKSPKSPESPESPEDIESLAIPFATLKTALAADLDNTEPFGTSTTISLEGTKYILILVHGSTGAVKTVRQCDIHGCHYDLANPTSADYRPTVGKILETYEKSERYVPFNWDGYYYAMNDMWVLNDPKGLIMGHSKQYMGASKEGKTFSWIDGYLIPWR